MRWTLIPLVSVMFLLAGCGPETRDASATLAATAAGIADQSKTLRAVAPAIEEPNRGTVGRVADSLDGYAGDLSGVRKDVEGSANGFNEQIGELEDKIAKLKTENAKRGTWMLYLFASGGILGAGLGVFLIVQGLGKYGVGISAGSGAVSALALLYLRYGRWFLPALGIVMLVCVAWFLVIALLKYRAGIAQTAAALDILEPADEVKAGLALSQTAKGIKRLVAKARGK